MASNVVAIVPARTGSKGVPRKNFKELAGMSPITRATRCCYSAGLESVWLTTDAPGYIWSFPWTTTIQRPPELAQDDTPMIDVVKHALSVIAGADDQIILLVQPTQPLRQPKHLRAAIELLESSGADSVVSVVELPPTHNPWAQLVMHADGQLVTWYDGDDCDYPLFHADSLPDCRQKCARTFIRDGTVYAFRRCGVAEYGDIYGQLCMPLIIPASESQALDTPEDWAEAERRLRG